MTSNRWADASARARAARDRAAGWLLDHVGTDGEPTGANLANGWSRIPWTLALAGHGDAGCAVLAWAERDALEANGAFRPGPAAGSGRFGGYTLGHLAVGAWRLEHFGLATRLLDRLAGLQDRETGGILMDRTGGSQLADLLCTAQAGIAAIAAGRTDIADPVRAWIGDLYAGQTALPARLYNFRNGADLATTPEPGLEWLMVTDFSVPRQSYFYPGIAAAFLAQFASWRSDASSLELARKFLRLNIEGSSAQFDDPGSVQVCKFGWGLAAAHLVSPEPEDGDWMVRMVDWFIAHQSADGSWAPSAFLSPEPNVTERMAKTAEHGMEIDALAAALGKLGADRAEPDRVRVPISASEGRRPPSE